MKTQLKRFWWLLIWLGLGLSFGAFILFSLRTIMVRSSSPRELHFLKDLVVAIKSFEAEYHRFPLCKAEPSKEDLTVDTANNRLIGNLMGQDLYENPRAIKFVDLPMAKDGRTGLVGSEGSYSLVDSLGNPYQIVIDTNRDSRVLNPDFKNTETRIRSNAPEFLPMGVIVFSGGADGVLGTGDDRTSWRLGGRSPDPATPSPNPLLWIGLTLSIIGVVGVLFHRRSQTSED